MTLSDIKEYPVQIRRIEDRRNKPYIVLLTGDRTGTVIQSSQGAVHQVGKTSQTWSLEYFEILE